MTSGKASRRNVLTVVAGSVGGCAIANQTAAAILTPNAAEGPFYPRPAMRKPDIDNDLVKIAGQIQEAGGEIFVLRGTISAKDGTPLVGHRIEIWQCDMNGRYLHPSDHQSMAYDHAFQGFGHDITDETGSYIFRTIKPTIYPGRAPHIHVKVFEGDRELLTTQFYVKDDPNNARDSLFRRLSDHQADAVSMTFVSGESGLQATVDITI